MTSPTEEARQLLSDMRALAEKARRAPDAKAQALLAWVRENVCPAVGLGEDTKASRRWGPRRVLLFTEYADTKRYLVELLTAAVAHTDKGEQRIRQFHGGMGDDARDDVQRAFNSEPEDGPVRILVATDAAREGVNLQAHCADLFHVDIPWNPRHVWNSATGESTAPCSLPMRCGATTSSTPSGPRTKSSRPWCGRSTSCSASSAPSGLCCWGSSRRPSRGDHQEDPRVGRGARLGRAVCHGGC